MRLTHRKISEIRLLRRKGFSIPEISTQCFCPKSTVSRYVKDIKILPQYLERWSARRNSSKIISQRNWNTAKEEADQMISSVNKKELAIIAASLYWAEGAKKDFSLSNTDPKLIRVFLYALRNTFEVRDENIKISLRIYEDLNRQACLLHWSKVTGIALNNHTSVTVLKGFKSGKLLYGMCRIRVTKGGHLLKKMISINNRVQSLVTPS